MPYRDEEGHFISEDEARERGLIPDNGVAEDVEAEAAPRVWAEETKAEAQPIFVDVGRGEPVQVQPGAPFEATTNRLAEDAHYGGFFRVFLNGSEVINPEDAPATFESGMRVAITSYDKVG